MHQTYVLDFEHSWEHYLPLVEFVYDNSYNYSILMAHFEAFIGDVDPPLDV